MPNFELILTPTAPDTVAAVSIESLTRSDTGQTPGGVTLPLALTVAQSGSSYVATGSFTDSGGTAPFYSYTFQVTLGDNSILGPYAGTLIGANAVGYYESQSDIQNIFGVFNVATWSNRDNELDPAINGNPQPDSAQVQYACNRTDAFINWMASQYDYATPIPTTIAQWPRLNYLAAEDAGIELYVARGILDENAKDEAGRMAMRRKQLRGYTTAGGKKVTGEIEDFFIAGIPDAPTQGSTPFNRAPEIILSSVLAGYGGSNSFQLPASWVPVIP